MTIAIAVLIVWRVVRGIFKMKWQPIETAPRDKEFLCRRKNKPHITFEAFIDRDSESYEFPDEYETLCNKTYPSDILDEDWCSYEWSPLPEPPEKTQ